MASPARLYRSPTGAIVFGVCGGLARYFRLDPALVRAAFVVLALGSAVGVVLYFLLALLMPDEPMRDEPPAAVVRENVRQLGRTARSVLENLAEDLRGGYVPRGRRRAAGVLLTVVGGVWWLSASGLWRWLAWNRFWPLALLVAGLVVLAGSSERGTS